MWVEPTSCADILRTCRLPHGTLPVASVFQLLHRPVIAASVAACIVVRRLVCHRRGRRLGQSVELVNRAKGSSGHRRKRTA